MKHKEVINIRFKARFTEVKDDETIHTPHVEKSRWQKCETVGKNIVWNDLDENEKVKAGDEKYIKALWMTNDIKDEVTFYADSKTVNEAHIEPKFYVDYNQDE